MQTDYSNKIRTFGALGYSAERIADLLGLKGVERAELLLRLIVPGDDYHAAWQNGRAIGEWNVDAELAKLAERGDTDAIHVLAERSRQRVIRDMKNELFGL
jgi:hypothetical protein